jgi:hypothetical protein
MESPLAQNRGAELRRPEQKQPFAQIQRTVADLPSAFLDRLQQFVSVDFGWRMPSLATDKLSKEEQIVIFSQLATQALQTKDPARQRGRALRLKQGQLISQLLDAPTPAVLITSRWICLNQPQAASSPPIGLPNPIPER